MLLQTECTWYGVRRDIYFILFFALKTDGSLCVERKCLLTRLAHDWWLSSNDNTAIGEGCEQPCGLLSSDVLWREQKEVRWFCYSALLLFWSMGLTLGSGSRYRCMQAYKQTEDVSTGPHSIQWKSANELMMKPAGRLMGYLFSFCSASLLYGDGQPAVEEKAWPLLQHQNAAGKQFSALVPFGLTFQGQTDYRLQPILLCII